MMLIGVNPDGISSILLAYCCHNKFAAIRSNTAIVRSIDIVIIMECVDVINWPYINYNS